MENEAKLKRALSLLTEIELRKKLYDELDAVVCELQAKGFVSAEVEGQIYDLVDNFKETNVQWRQAAVKRFEIKQRKTKRAR